MPRSGSSIVLPAELRAVKGKVLEVLILLPAQATSMAVALELDRAPVKASTCAGLSSSTP